MQAPRDDLVQRPGQFGRKRRRQLAPLGRHRPQHFALRLPGGVSVNGSRPLAVW